jgi:hypothetical protein
MSSYHQFQGRKAKFGDMLEAEDQNLHNSNMLNLVSAVRSIDNETKQLEERLKALKALKIEITDFADNGDIQDTTKVSEFFSRAEYGSTTKRTNW